MENELEVVNIRLVKEPSLYSEQTLVSTQDVVEFPKGDQKDGEGVIPI